ncbi:MAG: hypothetical protein ACXAC2_22320 [Candidatus Kariarchaeaceae archaeon]
MDARWPNLPDFITIFMATALVIPPFFMFLYGFNNTNSLFRKDEKSQRQETRIQFLKKAVIFFVIAEFSEGMAGLVVSPEHLLNYLFTWELFHIFSLSTLVILIIFELAWFIESKMDWEYKQVTTLLFLVTFVAIIGFFLLFHNYSDLIRTKGIYVNLDLNSILQRIFFEDGQNPIIPWISFPIGGALIASVLDLQHKSKYGLFKPLIRVLSLGICILILGVVFLEKEPYRSTAVLYPASSSFVLISLGVLILITTILIIGIDLPSRERIIKAFSPIVLISNISLSVFIFHNVAFIIPPDSPIIQSLVPTLTASMIVGVLYCVIIVFIAIIWKRVNFKYSVELMIWKLQRIKWRWWIQ